MNQLVENKGSFLGGILLIAGSAIGGGMLGLPMVTGLSGLYPALFIFAFCWVFMTVTALLLLEVNLFYGNDINFIGMTQKSLGEVGKVICWATYLFLFYSMLVAYIDSSGSLSQQLLKQLFEFNITHWQGSLFFTLLFGIFVFLGTGFVDHLNRFFMLGLIVTYLFVLVLGAKEVQINFFENRVWTYSVLAIPVCIASFGYHNIIPTLTSYLKKDRSKIIWMILIGGAIPLIVYIFWDWLILGVVPSPCFSNKLALDQILGFVANPLVKTLSIYFAFFAIVTSFLAQALALLDFLRDALKLSKHWFHRLWLTFVVLTPPFFFAMMYPGAFIIALGLVGGFATMILFVFIPSFMVWELRYKRRAKITHIIPGGRLMLSGVIFIGLCVMTLQLIQEIFSPVFLKGIFYR